MGIQKKHGKGRLDRYYHMAKEKGYRARAAFKLIQLNKKYHILEKSKVLLDLCAAPGSWCQVASEVMPINSLIVGVDLAPIKSIPRCITFQSDITTDKCRATIRQHLKTLKADTVLHDGAPNVGTAWVQDAFSQAELVLQSLRLATDFLAPGGNFVTKVFRSKDYNKLLWVFNQLFKKVEATKPPSSRNVSAEIFVVCLDFKAPKRIDPRLLDPKTVFAELPDAKPNNEAKVFNPEVKKRKRDGYEEGNYTQHKEVPVSEFIETDDPIDMLGSMNTLSFRPKPNGDVALTILERLPETTEEIRICCADLKVLGKKEFRMLLRWRLKLREKLGFRGKKKPGEKDEKDDEEVAEIEPMDEEMKIQEEMERLKELSDSRKKKDKRRENERKRKEIVRMQMSMTTPQEIGVEQAGPSGEDSMFALRNVEKAGSKNRIVNGKMYSINTKPEPQEDEDDENDDGEDDYEDDLEGQLDEMYSEYQERRSEADAKYRAKKARKEHRDGDDDFEGFSDREEGDVSSDEDIVQDDDSDFSDEENTDDKPLFNTLNNQSKTREGLSSRAAMFFDQDIFKGIDISEPATHDDSGIELDDDSEEVEKPKPVARTNGKQQKKEAKPPPVEEASDSEDEDGFEVVKRKRSDEDWTEGRGADHEDGRPNVDIITAEAMTLAHDIATGKQTRQSLLDDNFNKYTLRDVDGLPEWFLDDEGQHSKIQRPITAAGAAAIKEKLRALNARPIKKVREAKARKKMRAATRLEKLKKKSAILADDDDMTEKDKAQTIQALMSKAGKKRPRKEVKVVVARGSNRGVSGRPRGTKGKYKMVDSRMKKDTRALKRLEKKKKR